mmetsp:Transcript_7449/g.24288  ORF Transcript_7449/g.24288 Transcript_7449/m.24288 type:complete len:210 (-) Transcript_7449:680-1309(-)
MSFGSRSSPTNSRSSGFRPPLDRNKTSLSTSATATSKAAAWRKRSGSSSSAENVCSSTRRASRRISASPLRSWPRRCSSASLRETAASSPSYMSLKSCLYPASAAASSLGHLDARTASKSNSRLESTARCSSAMPRKSSRRSLGFVKATDPSSATNSAMARAWRSCRHASCLARQASMARRPASTSLCSSMARSSACARRFEMITEFNS